MGGRGAVWIFFVNISLAWPLLEKRQNACRLVFNPFITLTVEQIHVIVIVFLYLEHKQISSGLQLGETRTQLYTPSRTSLHADVPWGSFVTQAMFRTEKGKNHPVQRHKGHISIREYPPPRVSLCWWPARLYTFHGLRGKWYVYGVTIL